jgi:CHAD domain-containing protein
MLSKWFLNLNAATLVPVAARTVLKSRARTVSHFLSRVIAGTQNPENVHQLRVATRRFSAALSIFQECLRTRDHERLRHLSRSLRRVAGAVRDLDVQRDMVAARAKAFRTSGEAIVAMCDEHLGRLRLAAEKRLLEVARRRSVEFTQCVQQCLDRMQTVRSWPQKLERLARRTVRRRLKKLRAAGREDLSDLELLHQLRIAAKRLRYAMEVVAGCYSSEFRGGPYRVVERIQTELGVVNDLRHLIDMTQTVRSHLRHSNGTPELRQRLTQLQAFRERLRNELERSRSKFCRRWSPSAQRQFHRRVKNLLNQPSVWPRVHGTTVSKL